MAETIAASGKSDTLRDGIVKGIISGSTIFTILGTILFVLTGASFFGISGVFAILFMTVIGATLGGIYGVIPGPSKIIFNILFVLLLIALVVFSFNLFSSGASNIVTAPLGIEFESISLFVLDKYNCIKDPVDCLFKPFYDWSEPTVVEENVEEISVDVDLSSTNSVFFSGEDITVKANLIVNNKFEPLYTIEPKCFLNGEEMEIVQTPRVDGGLIDFKQSEIDQRVSIICEKKGGLTSEELDQGDKEIKTANFELHLLRSMSTKSEWGVYSLSENVLNSVEDPFENVNDPDLQGRLVLSRMKFDSPIKLSIGSNNDQPFFTGKWPFSVVIQKRDLSGDVLNIDNIVVQTPLSNNVNIVQPCEIDSLTREKLDRATKLLNDEIAVDIPCSLQVSNLDSLKQTPEKTIFNAQIDFDFESIHKRKLTILEKGQKEQL